MRLFSWNVNGVRAATKKGLFEWLEHESPDILCIQETKAHVDQLGSEILKDHGYNAFWHSGERRGYSCLLYTSPSPRDMRRSRMPSSA